MEAGDAPADRCHGSSELDREDHLDVGAECDEPPHRSVVGVGAERSFEPIGAIRWWHPGTPDGVMKALPCCIATGDPTVDSTRLEPRLMPEHVEGTGTPDAMPSRSNKSVTRRRS